MIRPWRGIHATDCADRAARRHAHAAWRNLPREPQRRAGTTSACLRNGWIAAALAVLLIGGALSGICNRGAGRRLRHKPLQLRCTSPMTLAVLPFADLSQAKDQEYFSDGLTEEILNQLAQIRELHGDWPHVQLLVQGQERGPAEASRRSSASPTCLRAACAGMATTCASPRSSLTAGTAHTSGRRPMPVN